MQILEQMVSVVIIKSDPRILTWILDSEYEHIDESDKLIVITDSLEDAKNFLDEFHTEFQGVYSEIVEINI